MISYIYEANTLKTEYNAALQPMQKSLPLQLFGFSPLISHPFSLLAWISPRPISNCQLHTLLCFHLSPIYLVVFKGSY